MDRILELENCEDCNYHEKDGNFPTWVRYCNNPDSSFHNNQFMGSDILENGFPEGCPLNEKDKTIIQNKIVKCRKNHYCEICGKTIKRGKKTRVIRHKDEDGHFYGEYLCLKCNKLGFKRGHRGEN